MARRKGKFHIFSRTFWRMEKGERVPALGRKTTLGYAETEAEARDFCRVWNASHEPGALSRKAEFREL